MSKGTGHRGILMRDHPLPVNLAEVNGRTPPNIGLLPVCPGSADPVKTVAESHVIARSDAQVANVVANRTLERG
jgi:hypothetical protein